MKTDSPNAFATEWEQLPVSGFSPHPWVQLCHAVSIRGSAAVSLGGCQGVAQLALLPPVKNPCSFVSISGSLFAVIDAHGAA